MKKAAQLTSTQSFIEIDDIRENVVLLKGGDACMVIRVTSVNFALLSAQEQDSKVFAYAALLNSLSFPVQILVRSKPLEIAPYISSLEDVIQKTANPNLKLYVEKYKDFVQSLVQSTTVLDKQFFIVVPYYSLEGRGTSLANSTKNSSSQETFFQQAQSGLQTKAESLLSQIHRLSLQATILQKDELTKLFYDIYNQGQSFSTTVSDIENPIVKSKL